MKKSNRHFPGPVIGTSGYYSRLALILLWLLAGRPGGAAAARAEASSGPVTVVQWLGQGQTLGNLSIDALHIDQRGFLWVGTENGLFRYDGRKFDRFGAEQGLPSSWIFDISESGDGTLWASTYRGLAKGTGLRWQPLPGAPELVSTIARRAFPLPGGQVLAQMQHEAAVLNDRGALVRRVGEDLEGMTAEASGRAWIYDKVALWTVTSDGKTSRRWGREQGIPGVPVSVVADARGTAYVAGEDWIRTVCLTCDRATALPAPNRRISKLVLLKDGTLVALAERSLWRWRDTSWELWATFDLNNAVAPTALAENAEGSLFIAFPGAGIARWRPVSPWTYSPVEGGLGSWTGLTRGADGRTYVAGQAALSVLTSRGAEVVYRGPVGSAIRSIAAAGPYVWIGYRASGLVRWDTRRRRAEVIVGETSGHESEITRLDVDPQGLLWVSTRGGLFMVDAAAAHPELVAVPLPRSGRGAGDATAYRTMRSTDGALWVATLDGLYLKKGKEFQRLGVAEGLRGNDIVFLTTRGDEAWVGYGSVNGISRVRMRADGFEVTHYSTQNTLPSDNIAALESDGRGGVWVGTDSGVSVVRGGRWQSFGPNNGLVWTDVNMNGIVPDAEGVWVLAAAGNAHLKTELAVPATPTTVLLTRVTVDGRERALANMVSVETGSNVEVEFRNPSIASPPPSQYRYQVSGGPSSWSSTAQETIVLTGMSAGLHTLEIQSLQPDGSWSTPATLSIDVIPVWSETLWFRTLLLAAAMAATVAAMRWREVRLREQRAALEAAVEQRTHQILLEKQRAELQTIEIERLLERAEAAHRLQSEFLANISHEIRTPMNGLLGMIQLTLGTRLTTEQREYIELADMSGRSLLSLLNDLLDFSKIEAGRVSLESVPFSLLQLGGELVRQTSLTARAKGLAFQYDAVEGVPDRVLGDPIRLRQVLGNLLSNAVKFTERGSVRLAVQSDAGDPHLVRFTVSDTGIGIAHDQQDSIFDPFQQADGSTTRKYGGTGLGLAICRRLVDAMGGQIKVYSEPGTGATFTFAIPLPAAAEASATQELLAPAAVPALFGKREGEPVRVLLVEDNPVSRRFGQRLLERQGCDVIEAENGAVALQILDTIRVDIILMDLQMPEMDGLTATQRIREAENRLGIHTPIVIVTASGIATDRETAIGAGADDFLTKPIQVAELYRVLEHHVVPQ